MRLRVCHRTLYTYSEPVDLCHNEAHLMPRSTGQQVCTETRIEIEPAPQRRAERLDVFGNRVVYFAVQEPHAQLAVTATSTIDAQPATAFSNLGASPMWESARPRLHHGKGADLLEAQLFALESPLVPTLAEVAAYAQESFRPSRPLLDAVSDLTARIYRDFTFDPHFSTVATPLEQVLAERRGVCQDFAHLAIACLRTMGLAARYVSGYLETEPPPGQVRLQGADMSHAWFAAFVPEVGWVDFDPTNNLLPGERYVTTAWGRDYADVAPLKGVIFGGGAHAMEVGVDVVRVAAPQYDP